MRKFVNKEKEYEKIKSIIEIPVELRIRKKQANFICRKQVRYVTRIEEEIFFIMKCTYFMGTDKRYKEKYM